MNIDDLKTQLLNHEEYRQFPYRCSGNKLTVAIGRNLEDKGISAAEALVLLENDINECFEDLKSIFTEFEELNENRQHALIDMRFNLGASGFRGFKKMIEAVKENDFDRAAAEMKDSRWYGQVGRRAKNLILMMQENWII